MMSRDVLVIRSRHDMYSWLCVSWGVQTTKSISDYIPVRGNPEGIGDEDGEICIDISSYMDQRMLLIVFGLYNSWCADLLY